MRVQLFTALMAKGAGTFRSEGCQSSVGTWYMLPNMFYLVEKRLASVDKTAGSSVSKNTHAVK
jgi:hypothetical protein